MHEFIYPKSHYVIPEDKIEDAKILDDIYGSDHCPVELDLNI